MAKAIKKTNHLRGALFAIGGPVVGIAAWVVLWQLGFIASIATFVMAWLTVWLYRKGAGDIDRRALYVILPYIFVGIVLSILSGIVDDCLHYVAANLDAAKNPGMLKLLFNHNFWAYMFDNLLHNGKLWSGYATDILFALGLGGLGVYRTIMDVVAHGRTSVTKPKPGK
jgi:hypothetical protein